MLPTFAGRALLLLSLVHSARLQTASPTPQHWNYDREGPDTWEHHFETCEGEAQSPIDIRTAYVKHDPRLTPLVLNGYGSNGSSLVWNVTHNGHTIVAYPPPLARLSMSGGGLPTEHYLIQFHFHWGYNAFQGSEHTINGQKFPLEVHFVHRAPYTNALAVLGVLFTRERDDNPYLNDLLSVLNQTVNSSVSVQQQLDISRFLPLGSASRFYRYNGSLTTPPCTEGVTWTIMKRTIPISSSQLRVFFGNEVPFNFRPTQKLHMRKVYASFQPEPHEGGEEGAAEGDGHGGGGGGGHHSSASIHLVQVGHVLLALIVTARSLL